MGKLKMELITGLLFQVVSGKRATELLPGLLLTCPWHFAEKGEEMWVLRCLGACPCFIPSKATHATASQNLLRSPGMPPAGCRSQGQLSPALMEMCFTGFVSETQRLAKLPLPHSPSKLIKVSFPRFRFLQYLKVEMSCWIWQELIQALAVE